MAEWPITQKNMSFGVNIDYFDQYKVKSTGSDNFENSDCGLGGQK